MHEALVLASENVGINTQSWYLLDLRCAFLTMELFDKVRTAIRWKILGTDEGPRWTCASFFYHERQD